MVLIIRRRREREATIPLIIDSMISAKTLSQDKKVYSLIMRVDNRVGMLKDVSEYLVRQNINIVKTVIPEPATTDKKEVYLVMVIEIDKDMNPKKIANNVKKIDGVKSVDLREPIGSLLFPRLFPIMVNGERALIIPKKAFDLMMEARDKYGIAWTTVFNQIAREMGRGIYRLLVSFYGEPASDEDYDRLSRVFIYTLEALGLGHVEIVYNNAKEGEVVFRLYDNIECSRYKSPAEKKGDFVGSFIEGFYLELWTPHRVRWNETRCIARGDNFCEFNVSVTL